RMLSLRIVLPLLVTAFVLAAAWPAVVGADEQSTQRARRFVQDYTAKVRPLEIAANRAWWEANITGKDEAFKAKDEAQKMRDAEVRKVLKTSTLSKRRQDVWEASKEVGKVVEADLKELVKLRNEAATRLGKKNYHDLMLYLNEQNGDDLIKLFDRLDELTR